jgi:hypothetical protein
MGASASKDKIVSSAIDRSSGFHIFELHMPTAGMGIGAIVLILLVLMMLNFCRMYLSARSKSSKASTNHHQCLERQQQPMLPAIQMQPYPMPMMMPPGHFPMSSLPTIREQGPRPKPLQFSTRLQELPVDGVAFAPPRQPGEEANSRDNHLYSPLPRSSPYSM